MNELNDKSTAVALRKLALQLDKGEDIPDFLICVVESHDHLRSAYHTADNLFTLLGLIHHKIHAMEREHVEDFE